MRHGVREPADPGEPHPAVAAHGAVVGSQARSFRELDERRVALPAHPHDVRQRVVDRCSVRLLCDKGAQDRLRLDIVPAAEELLGALELLDELVRVLLLGVGRLPRPPVRDGEHAGCGDHGGDADKRREATGGGLSSRRRCGFRIIHA